GMALKGHFGEMGRDAWDEWSATSVKFDPWTQDGKWASFAEQGQDRGRSHVGLGTIFELAKPLGWTGAPSRVSERPSEHAGLPKTESPDDKGLATIRASTRACENKRKSTLVYQRASDV